MAVIGNLHNCAQLPVRRFNHFERKIHYLLWSAVAPLPREGIMKEPKGNKGRLVLPGALCGV